METSATFRKSRLLNYPCIISYGPMANSVRSIQCWRFAALDDVRCVFCFDRWLSASHAVAPSRISQGMSLHGMCALPSHVMSSSVERLEAFSNSCLTSESVLVMQVGNYCDMDLGFCWKLQELLWLASAHEWLNVLVLAFEGPLKGFIAMIFLEWIGRGPCQISFEKQIWWHAFGIREVD